MKVLFSGGGTMGSVTPLLAIKEELAKENQHQFLWLGTKSGPEKNIVEENNITFKSVPSGKLRRYFDWRNFTDPFLILFGFIKSLWIIWRWKPDVILTAGSFVAVPVIWAGALLKKRTVLHQQDILIGLANKLMKPFVKKITVAFEELRNEFPKDKVIITGNPVRKSLFAGNVDRARQKFNLEKDLPTLLVVGGGLGAEPINQTFVDASQDLTKFCQVIHVTGRGEQARYAHSPEVNANPRYHGYEFLSSELADAYAVADLVVSRAGLGFLTELTALGKPAVIIPIPKNQQVANSEYFNSRKAIVYVRQEDLEKDYMVGLVQDLFENRHKLETLSENIKNAMPENATEEYVRVIKEMAQIVDI